MRDLAALKKQVVDDWADPELILRLVDAVVALPTDAQRYLTLPILRELGNLQSLRETSMLAEYLAGERVGFLAAHYLLITGDETTREIDDEAVFEALSSGVLHDPATGEDLLDWESKVIPFFEVRREGVDE